MNSAPVQNEFSGLTSQEANFRLKRFGYNQLEEKKEYSSLKIFISQFRSPLIYILVFAGIVTLFLKEITDSVVIFLAVILNTILGFYQEHKAQKSLSALKKLLAPQAKVIRDKEQKIIDARLLVPGDLVILTLGDRVPADGILIEANDISLNEAILTGESIPVTKKIKENVFMGTTVVTGIGKMLVEKTGDKTEIGKIGKQVRKVEEEKTPLQIQLAKLARILVSVVGLVTFFIFIFGRISGYSLLEMFTMSVAVAVAAVPEGLVVSLTVILTLGMQRILKRKAIVRKLLAAETLGSVSVICADKTGTLTEGKLSVVKNDFTDNELGQKAAILCNDLRDPLEVAMWEWAEEKLRAAGSNPEVIQEQYSRIEEIPFSHKEKIIATLHPGLLLVSGAPEVVLEKSRLSDLKKKKWLRKFEEYGRKGYRLVGFAFRKLRTANFKLEISNLKDLQWLGVLVYTDPIREGVKETLRECQKAGIKVKVITGDYLPTAIAVLRELGLDGGEYSLTGEQLEKMSQEELERAVGGIVLFARINPEQKLKIVQALKDKGEIVAMMGDGVNDAPALAKADVGIVVNEASDVARETADMVLLDSNFATIIRAIEEGRAIFENIKKVILYLLSDAFVEIILIGGSLLLGLPLPVTAKQILWINLAEDTLPSIAFAFEPPQKELMDEPPRLKGAPILDSQLKVLIFIIGIFLSVVLLILSCLLNQGFLHLHFIQTVLFVALGMETLFVSFACRSLKKPIFRYNPFSNKVLNFSVILGMALLLLAVYFPPLQALLNTQALGRGEWLFLLVLSFATFLTIEGFKCLWLIFKEKTI